MIDREDTLACGCWLEKEHGHFLFFPSLTLCRALSQAGKGLRAHSQPHNTHTGQDAALFQE